MIDEHGKTAPDHVPRSGSPTESAKGSDFAFKVLVNQFRVAIRALDPPEIVRDLQPDTRVPKRAFAAVTGYAVAINDAGLRCRGCHGFVPFLVYSR